MRISDWSSDVCSSDLSSVDPVAAIDDVRPKLRICWDRSEVAEIHKADVRNAVADADDRFIGRFGAIFGDEVARRMPLAEPWRQIGEIVAVPVAAPSLGKQRGEFGLRSEEHTSELQSLMRISYAVFCLKKK